MVLKFITAIALTILLAYLAYVFSDLVPWWSFAAGAFVAGIAVPQKAWLSWLSGFAGLFFCWGILSFTISSNNNHLLAAKMATVLPAQGSYLLLILITALIAAIIGGFASLAGTYLRKN